MLHHRKKKTLWTKTVDQFTLTGHALSPMTQVPIHEAELKKRSIDDDSILFNDQQFRFDPKSALCSLAKFLDIELNESEVIVSPVSSLDSSSSSASPSFDMTNIHFAVNGNVPASLTYIQVKNEDGANELKLVWDTLKLVLKIIFVYFFT